MVLKDSLSREEVQLQQEQRDTTPSQDASDLFELPGSLEQDEELQARTTSQDSSQEDTSIEEDIGTPTPEEVIRVPPRKRARPARYCD